MSWLDLIDDGSLDRFVSGGRSQGDEEDNDDDHLNGDQESGASIEEEDVTIPPPVMYGTEILNGSMIFDDDDEEEEDSSYGSVTIIRSVSSSITGVLQQQTRVLTQATTDVSISTMEDESSQESSSLSLHPDSLESSLMTEFTGSRMISSLSSEESSESSDDTYMEEVASIAGPRGDPEPEASDDRTEASRGQDSQAEQLLGTTTNTAKLSTARTEDKLKLWYSHFQTEQDWDEFREAANGLLKAMDCPLEDRDALIAQLIAAEEDLFWESKTNSVTLLAQPKTWLLELAAVAATVALTGVAIVRILKGR